MSSGELLVKFTQKEVSGGVCTAPAARLLMHALLVLLGAKRAIETGYDAGVTTEALAMSGAEVLGVDDLCEYSEVDTNARVRLAGYPNVTLVEDDALAFLKQQPDCSIDFIFVDERHLAEYVKDESEEIRRIMRPGGVAVFHDTAIFPELRNVVHSSFEDWQCMDLPAVSPYHGINFGISVVRKPE